MADHDTRTIENGDGFHSQTRWLMAALLLAAAAGVVLAFDLPLRFDVDAADFNPMVLLPVGLCVASLWNLVPAIRGSLRGRRFGKTVFEMEGQSVRPGETLRGTIRCSVALAPKSDFALVLRCIETVRYTPATEIETKTRDEIRWESTARVDARTADSRAGLPVAFALPRALAETLGANVRWTLEVRAALDGQDYYAIFGVPVAG